MSNFFVNISQYIDVNLFFYLIGGALLGLFVRRAIKIFLFISILLFATLLYNHYAPSGIEIKGAMAIVNSLLQKVTLVIKYIYNALTISKLSAIIIGIILSFFI